MVASAADVLVRDHLASDVRHFCDFRVPVPVGQGRLFRAALSAFDGIEAHRLPGLLHFYDPRGQAGRCPERAVFYGYLFCLNGT